MKKLWTIITFAGLITFNSIQSSETVKRQLTRAIEFNMIPEALKLIGSIDNINEPIDSREGTPLMVAANYGRLPIVEELLRRGAEVNKTYGVFKSTPLISAARTPKENQKVILKLIKSGATIDRPETEGSTPLYWAAFHGNLENTKALAEAGADINKARITGKTPLMAAAQEGHLSIVGYLIWKGANPLAQTRRGKTALDLAKTDAIKISLRHAMNRR